MAIRDLIPWSRGREVSVRRGEELNSFLTLHREVNRLFDDMSRGQLAFKVDEQVNESKNR
jgi:HSP20 family protein